MIAVYSNKCRFGDIRCGYYQLDLGTDFLCTNFRQSLYSHTSAIHLEYDQFPCHSIAQELLFQHESFDRESSARLSTKDEGPVHLVETCSSVEVEFSGTRQLHDRLFLHRWRTMNDQLLITLTRGGAFLLLQKNRKGIGKYVRELIRRFLF